jgi:hypothetical protein
MSKRLTDREKLLFKLDHLTDSEVEEVLEYVSIMEAMKHERRQDDVLSDQRPDGLQDLLDDDLLASLSAALENRRARQVFEWEAVRRRAEVRASTQHDGRR